MNFVEKRHTNSKKKVFLEVLLNVNNYFYLLEQTKRFLMTQKQFKTEITVAINTLALLQYVFPKEKTQLFKSLFFVNQIRSILAEVC